MLGMRKVLAKYIDQCCLSVLCAIELLPAGGGGGGGGRVVTQLRQCRLLNAPYFANKLECKRIACALQ